MTDSSMWRDLDTVNLLVWELGSILRATLSRAFSIRLSGSVWG